MSDFVALLAHYSNVYDLHLTQQEIEQLQAHFNLLQRWNKIHNLTAIKDIETAVEQHYLDCVIGLRLSASSFSSSVYDLGSGGGFPGIVLSVLFPSKSVFLVETLRKKCSFLRLVCADLKLHNTQVLETRIENLDSVCGAVTRATIPIERIQMFSSVLDRGATLVTWLSQAQLAKLTHQARSSGFVIKSHSSYVLPNGAQRAVAVLARDVPRETMKNDS